MKRLFSYITLHYEKALEMRGFLCTNFFVGAYYMRMHITPLITPLKIINICRILCLMLFPAKIQIIFMSDYYEAESHLNA